MAFRRLCAVDLGSGEMQVRRIPAIIAEYPAIAVSNKIVWCLLSANFCRTMHVSNDRFVFAKWDLASGSCCEVSLECERPDLLDADPINCADILLGPSGKSLSLVFYVKDRCLRYTTTLSSEDEQVKVQAGNFDPGDPIHSFFDARSDHRRVNFAVRTSYDGDYELPFNFFVFNAERSEVVQLSKLRFGTMERADDCDVRKWWIHRTQIWKDTGYSYNSQGDVMAVFVRSPQM